VPLRKAYLFWNDVVFSFDSVWRFKMLTKWNLFCHIFNYLCVPSNRLRQLRRKYVNKKCRLILFWTTRYGLQQSLATGFVLGESWKLLPWFLISITPQNGNIAPFFITFNTVWRWVTSFTLRPYHPLYPLHRRLTAGLDAMPRLSLGTEPPFFDRLALSLVTVMTELPKLPFNLQ
jgi:hypothetical protein